jgi:hypothetical protein
MHAKRLTPADFSDGTLIIDWSRPSKRKENVSYRIGQVSSRLLLRKRYVCHMEAAIGAASGLISTVLKQLSNELVEAYVASAELGLNSTKIKDDLMLTQGLLCEAQRRGVSNNPGLDGLLSLESFGSLCSRLQY